MAVRKRRRSVTSGLSMEAIEIRKLVLIRETNELLAQVIDNQRQLGAGTPPSTSLVTPYYERAFQQTTLPPGTPVAHDVQGPDYVPPNMPRVTTSPTGCQICGNPYAVFTEVRPGLSQYLCQIHARERSAQKAADAKVAAAGFSVDKTDARPQNIRLPEDNQRAKVLIHPTAADEIASRQHAQEASALQGDVQALADIIDEADETPAQ